MDVLIIGHSFVRRFRDHFCPGSRGSDITSPEQAEALAKLLSVDTHYQRIFTKSQGIVVIKDLYEIVNNIHEFLLRPTVIIFDIGSNDLAHLAAPSARTCLTLATELVDLAQTLNIHRLVKLVIIHSVVPRFSKIQSSIDVFHQNTNLLNKYLVHLCSSTDCVKYNKLRGFLQRDRLSPNLTWWTSDGIHPNTKGYSTYKTRLQHGLLYNRHCFQ